MTVRYPMHALVAVVALTAAAGASADPLPLRRGTYVIAGTPCADPPFAAMREWDGLGLADPHSHACRLRVLARRGPAYVVDNSCIGTGVGPGKRTGERLTITPRRDGMIVGDTRYAYCPAASLPPSLRTRAVR